MKSRNVINEPICRAGMEMQICGHSMGERAGQSERVALKHTCCHM